MCTTLEYVFTPLLIITNKTKFNNLSIVLIAYSYSFYKQPKVYVCVNQNLMFFPDNELKWNQPNLLRTGETLRF